MPSARAATDPATITAVSWWTLATAAPKPAGGFQVAQSANGSEMSVAAVKVKVNLAKLGSALLVLNEANTSLRSDGAGMLACLTTTNWTPGNPGLWSDVPPRDCKRTIQMVHSSTLKTWSADLLPFLNGQTGTVGVMFIPGAPPPGSIPIPTLESLPVAIPSLPIPVVGGVPIPPPIPALPAPLPPVDYPELPASVPAPVQIGYMIDINSAQIGALPPLASLAATGDFDGGDNGLLGGSGFDSLGGESGLSGTAAVTPPLAPSGSTADASPPAPLVLTGHAGRPWGRAWGLLLLAGLIGAGGAVVRRQVSFASQ
jgi:hypothetical protein